MTDDKKGLNVFSVFTSISGEAGPLAQGTPVNFVRLAGCDFRCGYCDTPNSLTASSGVEGITVDDLFDGDKLKNHADDRVKNWIITGGEPMLQWEYGEHKHSKLRLFIDELFGAELADFIQIETNGNHPIPNDVNGNIGWVIDWKLPSSLVTQSAIKMMEVFSNLPVDEDRPGNIWVKFVIGNRDDFDEAVSRILFLRQKYGHALGIAISPVTESKLSVTSISPALLYDWMMGSVLAAEGVVLNVQIHKWIWPDGEAGDKGKE